MALSTTTLAIPFSTSVDTKTDPLQVSPMSLVGLVNAVYTKDKRLTKRNGFKSLTELPSGVNPTTLTTFKGNLTVIGNSVQAYSSSSNQWINHGRYQPVQLSVLSITKDSGTQTACDSATSGTLVCTVYNDSERGFVYQINDSVTSQTLVVPQPLGAGTGKAKVYILGNYFFILYLQDVSTVDSLRYIAIPISNITAPTAPTTLATDIASTTTGYDAVTIGNLIYIAWNGSDVGKAVRMVYGLSTLSFSGESVVSTGVSADLLAISTDGKDMFVSFYQTSDTSLHGLVVNSILAPVLTDTLIDNSVPLTQITCLASSGVMTVYEEVEHTYSYDSTRTDYVNRITLDTAGAVGPLTLVARSVGLASKAFVIGDVSYFMGVYAGTFEPTYFMIDSDGNEVARWALYNAGGYIPSSAVLPSVTTSISTATLSYLVKDLLVPVNKQVNSISTGGIYTTTGVNMITLNLAGTNLSTAEIANNLHMAGGFLWMYDGNASCEHNFHLYPEDILLTPHATGGSMTDQDYYYQVVYEWTDAQGNIHRSAPSIAQLTTVSGGGGMGSVTLDIPTLRLTYKSNVRIVIYRWSTAQQTFYQITSIATPLLNDPTVDSVSYVDTQADTSILGNVIIYTNGGVIENIPMPASKVLGLFKSRLMVVDSEDNDLLWYSKPVVENVPVEGSDLFTLYLAPTLGAQGSTGETSAVAAMDDKFILFKPDAAYYIVGDGPNVLGDTSQSDFSLPTYISSTVGSADQNSIVLSPLGVMFQSDKGIWLLDRNLGTSYIGARVEAYNALPVTSATVIPGTNQVRFTLTSELVLMYDYYFDRWGTFDNIQAISSTLYQGSHTYLDQFGRVFQETEGYYLDGGKPVLLSFTTSWFNLQGLQGFERAKLFDILATYISPHTLSVMIGYDYETSPSQVLTISPDNYAGPWGAFSPGNYWGQGVWGGPGNLEQWRVFLNRQKMQAFQVTVQEYFDPSFGTAPGAGLTLSGLNLMVAGKGGAFPLPARRSVG